MSSELMTDALAYSMQLTMYCNSTFLSCLLDQQSEHWAAWCWGRKVGPGSIVPRPFAQPSSTKLRPSGRPKQHDTETIRFAWCGPVDVYTNVLHCVPKNVISQGKVVALDRWGGKWNHLSMTHRLTTNYAKNYCNRTLIVKVIVENVVTCFFGDSVYIVQWPCSSYSYYATLITVILWYDMMWYMMCSDINPWPWP